MICIDKMLTYFSSFYYSRGFLQEKCFMSTLNNTGIYPKHFLFSGEFYIEII